MASKTVLVDDLTGSEDDVKTVRFAVDGVNYYIDLSAESRENFNKVIAPFTEAAHSNSNTRKNRETQASKIRAWAKKHNIEVPAQGRIPKAVTEQWEKARGK